MFSRRDGDRSAAVFRRPSAAWVLVAWIAAWLVAAPAAAQAPSLETWRDPQVEVALPAGWHRLETAWVAERILLATPSPVEANDVAALDALDVEAALHVKIDALDPVLQSLSLDAIADAMLQQLEERLRGSGLELQVIGRGETWVSGYEAVVVSTRQDTTVSHALLARTDRYLYEVALTYESAVADRYQVLVQPVLSSVRLKDGEGAPVALEEHSTLLGSLRAPAGWHPYAEEGNVPRVVISREPVQGEGSRYLAGVALLKLPGYRRQLPPDAGLEAIYRSWLDAYVQAISETPYRLLNAGVVSHEAGPSLFIEASFQDGATGRFVQLFNLVTLVGDDFYIAVYEAPVEEFHLFRDAYLESLMSLRWR